MQRSTFTKVIGVTLAAALAATGCGRGDSASGGAGKPGEPAAVPGFDGKTIKLGWLGPLTGPVKVIADPIMSGNKAYIGALNDKGGVAGRYKVEFVVRDTKFTPQDTVIQYGAIKNEVVAFQQILGTAPLQAVQPQMDRDDTFAFAGTLDAIWYKDANLMPLFSPYQIQASNSIAYFVEKMGGKDKNVCTLVADNAFGNAGLEGVDHAAKQLGITIKSQAEFTPNQGDFTAQIDQLQQAECDAVWLGAQATDAAPILTRAAQTDFKTQWLSNASGYSMTWAGTALADYIEKHFVVAIEGVEWGDTSVPEMQVFLDAMKKHSPQQKPDDQAMYAWLQARALIQIITRAVELGDLSKKGVLAAAAATKTLNHGGIVSDQKFGPPAERDPSRHTTLYKATPKTLAANGGLTILAPDAKNFTTDAAKSYKFDLG